MRAMVPTAGLLFAALTAAMLWGCSAVPTPPPTVNFFHWETRLDLDSTEVETLKQFGSRKLYVKVFDVSWNGALRVDARLEAGRAPDSLHLIPVIFITNEVLARTPPAEISRLARNILQLTDERFPTTYQTLVVDLDWTARTQVQCFALLRAVQAARSGLNVQCTVRLHQYRDRRAQGIPPVDTAILMAYNTGNLSDWATENSIVDSTVIKSYLAGQPPYPIPLHLAVAAYDWGTVYRQGELAYLINEPDLEELADTSRFERTADNRLRVRRSTYLNGTYLYAEDRLRLEKLGLADVGWQWQLGRRYVGAFAEQEVVVYRLGSR